MTCPYCGRRVVDQFNLRGRCLTEEDQISVCAACSGICVLHQGVLCRPTVEELKTLLETPEVRSAVAGIIRGIAQAKHFRS